MFRAGKMNAKLPLRPGSGLLSDWEAGPRSDPRKLRMEEVFEPLLQYGQFWTLFSLTISLVNLERQ
jgi:hypothetical protein